MTKVTVSIQPKQKVTVTQQAKPSVSVYRKGDTGESAYELAVKLGYEGTEEEWINSMGALQKATVSEINAGTEATKYISPLSLAGSLYRRTFIQTEEPTAPKDGDIWIVKRV